MSKNEYESCNIKFDSEGNAIVTIKGKGSYKGLNVCNATKDNASITNENCMLRILNVDLDGGTDSVNYNSKYEEGSIVTLTEPTKDGYVFKGWTVSGNGASVNNNTLTMGSDMTEVKAKWVKLINFSLGQAEEGMTYGDWVNSTYGSGYIHYNNVTEGGRLNGACGSFVYEDSEESVYYSNLIKDGDSIKINISSGGVGPGGVPLPPDC